MGLRSPHEATCRRIASMKPNTGGRVMPSFLEISSDKLNRIVGTPNAPVIVDVRIEEDFARDPRLVPGSIRKSHTDVSEWAAGFAAPVIVVCQAGGKLSHGVAAHIRHAGGTAEVLEGGFEAWIRA